MALCNGDDIDSRAQRRCRCGGVQYDWGAGPCVPAVCRYSPAGKAWVMNWYCVGEGGCGRMSVEHMTYSRLSRLRQKSRGAGQLRGAQQGEPT
jgi:hypothetical protein